MTLHVLGFLSRRAIDISSYIPTLTHLSILIVSTLDWHWRWKDRVQEGWRDHDRPCGSGNYWYLRCWNLGHDSRIRSRLELADHCQWHWKNNEKRNDSRRIRFLRCQTRIDWSFKSNIPHQRSISRSESQPSCSKADDSEHKWRSANCCRRVSHPWGFRTRNCASSIDTLSRVHRNLRLSKYQNVLNTPGRMLLDPARQPLTLLSGTAARAAIAMHSDLQKPKIRLKASQHSSSLVIWIHSRYWSKQKDSVWWVWLEWHYCR